MVVVGSTRNYVCRLGTLWFCYKYVEKFTTNPGTCQLCGMGVLILLGHNCGTPGSNKNYLVPYLLKYAYKVYRQQEERMMECKFEGLKPLPVKLQTTLIYVEVFGTG